MPCIPRFTTNRDSFSKTSLPLQASHLQTINPLKMMNKICVLLILASIWIGVSAKREWTSNKGPVTGRLVRNDPTGLCDSVKSEAGYFKIEGSKNKNYFYWFFEARNNPETAPTILWMTGGPGCSSGIALFKENGPCMIDPAHQDQTKPNPFSWNTNANIMAILNNE